MANYAENRKARFNYEILETVEAGIVLSGQEVKSVRAGRASLEGSFASIRGGELFLLSSSIPPYQASNLKKEYDPLRARKLLVSKKEIAKLVGMEKTRGLTLVPLSMYNRKNRIKVEVAIARGKKTHDKREVTKKRETDREIRRTLKDK